MLRACLALTLLLTSVNGHGTEVVQCLDAGFMTIYVEHWHGALGSASSAGTMNIKNTGNSETGWAAGAQKTLVPDGVVNNKSPGDLPCGSTTCSKHSSCATRTTCSQTYNNWVFYRFTPACDKPVSYQFLQGNTVVLMEACSNLYPVTVSGTFNDNDGPAFDVDGSGGCNDITLQAPAGSSNGAATTVPVGPSGVFDVTAADACGTVASITPGCTSCPAQVGACKATTWTATDNNGNKETCTFQLCLDTPPPTAFPTEAPTAWGAVVVSGDPFTSYNGKTMQFYLPLGQDQLLLTCPGVELLGRARATGIPGDTQQWFDHFTVRPVSPQGRQVVSVGIRDWRALQTKDNATVGAATETVATALLGARNQRPLTTLDVLVDGTAVDREAALEAGQSQWKVDVSQGTKRIGSGHSDVVTVHAGDVRIRIQSAVAEKFATAEEQLRYMHLDLDLEKLDTKECSGVLPEIWGVRPMSASTSRLLNP